MGRKDGWCNACGSRAMYGTSPEPWGDWCKPCEDRMRIEEPWWNPSQTMDERLKAKADWELKNGTAPVIALKPCPFCSADQGESGPHFCTARSTAPYIVECMRCRCRTGGSDSFRAAAERWNERRLTR